MFISIGIDRLQSKPSPSPSPRKSLKDADEICQEEELKEKSLEQTSPVAKIRQFIGLEPNSHTNDISNVSNEESRQEVINESVSGKIILRQLFWLVIVP